MSPGSASKLITARDAEVLERLGATFRPTLVRYFLRRVPDAAEAEDMVQEVFLRLIRRGGVGELEKLDAYVFETAASVITDRARKDRTRRSAAHDSFDQDRHGGVDFSPEHVLINREQLQRVSAILLELPERTRVIFVLRRLEGLRYQEIAARLGISVSAVEKHVARAMAHLMRRLDRE